MALKTYVFLLSLSGLFSSLFGVLVGYAIYVMCNSIL